jgi:Protein of unknown function (DUF2934)
MSQHNSHPSHHVRPPEPIVTLAADALHKRVSAESIAKRAYEKFVARGRRDGGDREDWMAAERELNSEAAGEA